MLMDEAAFLRMLPDLLEGLLVTIQLTLLTLIIGMAIALPMALARNSPSKLLRRSAAGFVIFFRGPPLLVQLYLVYYGLPEFEIIRETWAWTFFRDAFFCAVVAFSLNSAGYVTEILAGAIRAVPRGEVEAAVAAGFPKHKVLRLVTLPHAARIALRSYGNEIVFVIKGTSIASLITIIDLMGAAQNAYFRTYDPFTPLLTAAVIYLVLVFAINRGLSWLERRLSPEYRIRSAAR